MIYSPTQRKKPSISGRQARRALLIIMIGWLTLSAGSKASAVTPAPDGGYPGENTAEGANALLNLTSGIDNTAVGFDALATTQSSMENTAVGVAALSSNTSGNTNTAIGYETLTRNTTGKENTAVGGNALLSNTIGHDNTATGLNALLSNTMGISNTANGVAALRLNTIGEDNTAVGISALEQNIGGSFNTAVGASALTSNSGGNSNTAVGLNALFFNSSGSNNTAHGVNALLNNTTGINNSGTGNFALQTNGAGHDNTAQGFQALKGNTSGSNNVAIGSHAGANLTTGNNNIDLGANAVGATGEANTIRIGKQGTQKAAFIAGIAGIAVAGTQVVVNSNGKLGVATSSVRFKEAIKPMDKASEAILQLKPVRFRYKEEIDPDSIPQFGLIAEEVEKVNADLVVRGEDGKVMTVRYEAVNAMLLNEFLKEHRKVEEQAGEMAQMKKQIEALTTTGEKVSDQVALRKPASQLVSNP
jgi:trimeric autotransporter adhesin